jgi:hypothetical protein
MFGTEIAFFFGRGNVSHTYSPGTFVTDGAEQWLLNAEIGHNFPNAVAHQLEAFVMSGCAKRIDEAEEGKLYFYCSELVASNPMYW